MASKPKAAIRLRRKRDRYPTERWVLQGTHWQLPCGCIGPDIWGSEEAKQSYCTDCGRGWWHYGEGPTARWLCEMLDGGPQGPPVLVLMNKVE